MRSLKMDAARRTVVKARVLLAAFGSVAALQPTAALAEAPFNELGVYCVVSMVSDPAPPGFRYHFDCRQEPLVSIQGEDSGGGYYPGPTSPTSPTSPPGGASAPMGPGPMSPYPSASSAIGKSSLSSSSPAAMEASAYTAQQGTGGDPRPCEQTLGDKLFTKRFWKTWGWWEDRSAWVKPQVGPRIRNVRQAYIYEPAVWSYQLLSTYITVNVAVTYCQSARSGINGAVWVVGTSAQWIPVMPWVSRPPGTSLDLLPVANPKDPLEAPSYELTFKGHFEKNPVGYTGASGGLTVGTSVGASGGYFQGNLFVDGLDAAFTIHVPISGIALISQ